MKGIASGDGHGAFLSHPTWFSNPPCMLTALCKADLTAEPELKFLNSVLACIAGLNNVTGMSYEKLHNSRCQLH